MEIWIVQTSKNMKVSMVPKNVLGNCPQKWYFPQKWEMWLSRFPKRNVLGVAERCLRGFTTIKNVKISENENIFMVFEKCKK